MKMRGLVAGGVAMLVCGTAQALPFVGDFAVEGVAGTLGVGGQVTVNMLPLVNGRVAVQGFSFDKSLDKDGVNYDGTLDLLTYGAYVDFYPLTRFVRLSAGLLGNSNKVGLDARCDSSCDVGDLDIDGSSAKLNGGMKFNSVSPYLGIGFSNPMKGILPFNLGFDAGVLMQGKPKVNLAASGTGTVTDDSGTRSGVNLATDPEVQQAVAQEESDLSSDVKNFKYYPVVMLSIGWRF